MEERSFEIQKNFNRMSFRHLSICLLIEPLHPGSIKS